MIGMRRYGVSFLMGLSFFFLCMVLIAILRLLGITLHATMYDLDSWMTKW
jgi:hypothetical protein